MELGSSLALFVLFVCFGWCFVGSGVVVFVEWMSVEWVLIGFELRGKSLCLWDWEEERVW